MFQIHLPLRGLLVVCALLTACSSPESPLVDLTGGLPDVVILALDTVRADHLGAYGNESVQTLNLDRFASESIVFEDCSSTSSWTLPSFASLFTGLLPYHHGAIGGEHQFLGFDHETMAARLAAAGYATEAFVAVDYLTDDFGMPRGFEQVFEVTGGAVSGRMDRYQPRVLSALRKERSRPLFLFAHYFDAHAPYDPPAPFDGMYYEGDPRDPAIHSIDVIHDSGRNRIQSDPAVLYRWLEGITDLAYPTSQYGAGITHLDHGLHPVFTALEETGRLDDSIVIVVADHGEHLTEHDVYFTHRFPYEECLHVPLMVRLPGGVGAGLRITEPVSLVDVLPTLLELLQMAPLRATDGLSLASLIRGDEDLDRQYLFAEYGGRESNMVKAVWDERHRLLRFHLDGQVYEELYDREQDPAESHDLSDELPAVRERLAALLDARFPQSAPLLSTTGEGGGEIPEDVRERLRTLGYVE